MKSLKLFLNNLVDRLKINKNAKSKQNEWSLPQYFIDNFETISGEYIRTIFERSESILAEKIQIGESITTRAFTIVGIAASAFALSVGFLSDNPSGWLKVSAIVESFLCFISMALLIKPIASRQEYPIGSSPKELFREEFIDSFPTEDEELKEELIMKNLYLNLAITNEMRITKNESHNRNRTKYVDWALFTLAFSPVLSVLTASAFSCWNLCHQSLN